MLRKLLLATSLLALAAPAAASAHATPPRAHAAMVGGHAAQIVNWPSIAFLLAGWDSDDDGKIDAMAGCTGSVVAPRWVLSAAHCAFRPDGSPVDAMVTLTGVQDINDPAGEAIAADQLVVDPDWNPDNLHGDALLVHLKSNSSRPPMPLAVPGGQYVTKAGVPNAAGWGTTDEDSTISTDILNEAYLELQDDGTCAQFDKDYDAATQTCAGTYETSGACHGDSGGPLIVFDKVTGKPVLWGLTSFGPQIGLGMKPCELHAPAFYSWVPGFNGFITQHIGSTTPPQGGGGNPNPQPTPTPTATPRPTPPAPVITPAPDRVAPVLAHARLARTRFKAKAGTKLSFDLSEAAALKLTILRQSGRRYKPVASLPLAASAGHTSRKLSTRRLKPGRYRLTLAAVDTSGNAAPLRTLTFAVTR